MVRKFTQAMLVALVLATPLACAQDEPEVENDIETVEPVEPVAPIEPDTTMMDTTMVDTTGAL
jgi:hypothetical protein